MTFKSINIGGRLMEFDRPKVMGIINVTPDSFYSGSRTPECEAIEHRAVEMVEQGVDIFDIGGYSTRPGADEISPEEEYARLDRGLEVLRRVAPEVPISVDTFRAGVARKCVENWGVEIINDIAGGTLDPDMFATIADLKVAYVLMHTRGAPATMQQLTDYCDVTAEVLSDLMAKVRQLRLLGVNDIILDPGFGFAKTVDQNFRLLAELKVFVDTGLPVLAGLSRKSMIWRSLDTTPAESLTGTTVLDTVALMAGADILRVHDVRDAKENVLLIEKLRNNSR
ncbi:MAG: dihydropteroate synthase [Muribaculaceae bacterium]|nr:dihydropteroate synthase [Muribaculaceae bacterium]